MVSHPRWYPGNHPGAPCKAMTPPEIAAATRKVCSRLVMPRKVMHFLGTDPPLPADSLAARVRAARAYANMTRRKIANATPRSDVTERTLARFEDPNGTSPSGGQISSIARACGLPVGFFVVDLQA